MTVQNDFAHKEGNGFGWRRPFSPAIKLKYAKALASGRWLAPHIASAAEAVFKFQSKCSAESAAPPKAFPLVHNAE
jgi:hypothetical protein